MLRIYSANRNWTDIEEEDPNSMFTWIVFYICMKILSINIVLQYTTYNIFFANDATEN